MFEIDESQNPEIERILNGFKGLWDMQQLADFLHINVQALYDYRYRQQIDRSVFVMVGRKLRIIPHRAVSLALKGELIKS